MAPRIAGIFRLSTIDQPFFFPPFGWLCSLSLLFFFSSSILFPLLFFKSSMLFGNRSPCYSPCKQQTRFHRCSEKLRRTVCKRLSNLRIASARSNFDKECSLKKKKRKKKSRKRRERNRINSSLVGKMEKRGRKWGREQRREKN